MLLINRFIRLVEDHAESLSLKWVQDIRTNPLTQGYAKVSREELHDLVYGRFRKLGQWVGKKEGRDRDIAQEFYEIGLKQADAGIMASEMVYSFMLERDLLWGYILDEGIVTEGIDLNRAIEFSNQLNYFYEKAIYFSLVGYEERMASKAESRDEASFHKTFEGFKHWIVK
ncbi:MAG: hypothetical protein HGA70_03385 [Chlorobiaceae bacterium]|nr:hypothetical protein [Chlorobiaceae bacterium]NTW09725.1 hypothetical protein [Chlorobiaceae bacterium]